VDAAAAADLVCVGRVGWTASARKGLGSTARALLAAQAHALLLVRRGEAIGRPAVVVYDGSESARRGLAAAVRMMGGPGGRVVVLVLAHGDHRAAVGAEAEALALRSGVAAQARYLLSTTPEAVAEAVTATHAGVLVLPVACVPSDETCRAAVQAAACPVLIVR
jgi:hypothetical protein